MTDKSFGDFHNKNQIKNPLLSSAVTGVSLDELTHKAVLLPVSPTQGLSPRSEQQGSQNATLSYTHHDQPNPAGDAFSNVQISNQTVPTIDINKQTLQKTVKFDENLRTTNATQSKASVKSEDDFDVNEYIARLQGTRYVSAPLHSHLKDDNNANLNVKEESLEEINLNENPNVEVQQSLTADLAQNFSQLPTVLPHVASAVFSSFSNMLNLRSRDQTPDEKGSHQEKSGMSFQQKHSQVVQQSDEVPLMVEERPAKALAPPPREPPVMTGPSNFRLPPKKKYAQIPGLSTGGPQVIPFSAQESAVPNYFNPGPVTAGETETENMSQNDSNVEVFSSDEPSKPLPRVTDVNETPTIISFKQTDNVVKTTGDVIHVDVVPNKMPMPTVTVPFTPGNVGQREREDMKQSDVTDYPSNEPLTKEVQSSVMPIFFTPGAVNVGKSEIQSRNRSNTAVFHSNEPSKLEAQTSTVPRFFTPDSTNTSQSETTNIKAANTTNSNAYSSVPNELFSKAEAQTNISDFFSPTTLLMRHSEISNTNDVTNYKLNSTCEPYLETAASKNESFLHPNNKEVGTNSLASQVAETRAPIIPPPPMFSNLKRDGQSGNAVEKSVLPPSVARRISANQPLIRSQTVPVPLRENIFVPDPGLNIVQNQNSQSQGILQEKDSQSASRTAMPTWDWDRRGEVQNAPPTDPAFFTPYTGQTYKDLINVYRIPFDPNQNSAASSSQPTNETPKSAGGPQIFNPYSQPSESQSTDVPMFAASQLSAAPPPPSYSQHSAALTLPVVPIQPPSISAQEAFAEPPKPLIEPPKATGAVNFRMTKKRPQYYSGPIEGFGSISNQVKPTIPTAGPITDFQNKAAVFTPEPTKLDETRSEGFTITPAVPSYEPPQGSFTAPFDLSQAQSQDFDTAFDLSRPTTEAYDEPKQEPTGFGIIGSLKSKLSSINMNTIQNTVTTFFDPAYNEAKENKRDDIPSVTPQTDRHNLYGSSDANDNTKYDDSFYQRQMNLQGLTTSLQYGYNLPEYNENEIVYSLYDTETRAANVNNQMIEEYYQNYATYHNQMNYTNIDTQIPNVINDKTESISLPQPDVITTSEQHYRDESSNKIENVHQGTQDHKLYHNQPNTNLLNTSQLDASDTSFHGDNSNQFGHVGSVIPQRSSVYTNYPQNNMEFEIRDVNPDIIEDTLKPFPNLIQNQNYVLNPQTAASFFDTDIDSNINVNDVPTLANLGVVDDEAVPTQDIPTNYNIDNISTQRNTVIDSVNTARLIDSLNSLTVSGGTREATVENVSNNKAHRRESSEAIKAVSTAPLFGLSEIIADRSREVDTEVRPFDSARRKSMIVGSTSSASFFESIPTNDNKFERKDLKGLSITDIRNVVLMEPPQEDICAMLKRNASTNLDNAASVPEVTKDTYNLDTSHSSFFDHTLRDDAELDESDLNICVTCREVNTLDGRIETVTSQLIDNLTSRIPLSNVIEFPYIENVTANVPVRETAIDDQMEEIRNITEDTIETLQAQLAIERLNESPNPEYAAYSTAIQSCKYAFEDPEPIIRPNFNDSSLFYHNRLPDEAGDDNNSNRSPSISDDDTDGKSEEAGLDVHLIEEDANQDFPIDEEFVIEPSEADDDIETMERLRRPVPRDTFTNRVERFQKAVDAGECFTYNSPTSLASYFDTGNYAVEAHFRNSLTSPDLANLRFPPGFEDEYDRRMSGYNGSPVAPQIPDCTTQTKVTNTATFSSAHGYRRYSDDRNIKIFTKLLTPETDKTEPIIEDTIEDFRDPATAHLFVPTAPELSVIEAATPDLSTKEKDPENSEASKPATCEEYQIQELDKSSQELENEPAEIAAGSAEQNAQEIGVTEELKLEESPVYNPQLSQDNTQIPAQDSLTTNVLETQTTVSNFFETTTSNKLLEDNSTVDSKPLLTSNIQSHITEAGDFFKPQEQIITNIKDEASKTIIQETKAATDLFTPKPNNNYEAKSTETKSIEIIPVQNFFEADLTKFNDNNPRSSNKTSQPQNTSTFELKSGQDIAQTLPDPKTFFSSKDEDIKSDNSDFNRLASYFATPVSKPDHSKSFFELSQSQNHYRHSSSNNQPSPSQNNLGNDAKLNLTNLIKDLTSTQNIPQQETIVRTVNHFTIEYDTKTELKNEVKELVNETNKLNKVTSKGDTLNDINKTKQNDLSDNADGIETQTLNQQSDDKLIQIIKHCHLCKINTKEIKVKKCMNGTETKKETISPDMEQKVTKKPNPSEHDSMFKNDEAEDGVTVVIETRTTEYTPVRHHWFYRFDVEDKSVWRGFSVLDSNALEEAFHRPDLNENTLVATDGGRFDVNIVGRLRFAVYWNEKPTNVRRCSWFYKGTTDSRYVPYTENVADKLEEEYRHGITTGEWHRRLILPNNEVVIMHGPTVMVHFWQGTTDAFSTPAITLLGKRVYRNPPKIRVAKDQLPRMDHLIFFVHGAGEYKRNCEATSRPRVVRRGHEESEIEEASPTGMDHLLLLCHGVGSACDMRFRSVEEVVEDFRATSLQLVQSHYKNSYDNGVVSRVEVLPISWHAQLHGGEAGVDRRLQRITLDSIPRLRAFTNHTVLDVLFYTSPVYHQTIIDTVCFELNRIYNLFKKRNPNFKGGISLGGHSLGSVILYDLLCNQVPTTNISCTPSAEKTYLPDITSTEPIKYPVLHFQPDALYALGSPIAIFECIRGVETLGLDFCLPTCKNFFNIFHPYDPIAYRIEPLVNSKLQDMKPFLIPHHKGRKRMHLELKDTMVRVGADLKQKLLESLRTTWNKWKATPPNDGQLEKVVEEEMEKEQLCDETKDENQENIEMSNPDLLGHLNSGRRIDYVLQEAPLEMINEYLFAMSSHVGYWESEDTMLLMLREIYSALGVQPDSTVPQQSMTVQRTRMPKMDEAMVVNEKECPSTSRGGVL